jgi:hypothetical protein
MAEFPGIRPRLVDVHGDKPMNKPALLAAALLPLLGGCISNTCNYPTVTLQWSLQDLNGLSWKCGPAGVSTVDVYINDALVANRPCTDYGATIDVSHLAPGPYPVVVEGLGADGYIYDRSLPFDVSVGECGDSYAAPVLGEALLDIAYGFSPNVCHGGYMWYALWDEVAGLYISVVDAASGAYRDDYDCPGLVKPLQFSVPFGSYTLAWIQEVVDPLATAVPVQQACVQLPPLVVDGPGTFNYPVTLVDNTVTPLVCPAYP